MSSSVEEPSQAERLEDVALAGAGADDKENVGDQTSEKAPNGSVEIPSKESDEIVEATADAGSEEKPPVTTSTRAKQREDCIDHGLAHGKAYRGCKFECERY